MPIESRRRKDDTWTSEELNQALKGSKDDMLRKKRRDEEGDHRRHREEVNGSDHRRRDGEKDRHRSKSHKDREDAHVKLSELDGAGDEERERMRLERRAKKEGGKEEKPSRHKESSKPSKPVDSDDDDRKRRHHRDRDEDRDRHGERRHHRDREDGESGSRRHREEKDERRHHDRDKEHKSNREHRKKDEDEREHRRHRDENDDDNRKRRHHDEGSDRRKRREEESRRPGEDDEERERKRQERREKREKDKSKEKENDKEKERSHRRSERRAEDDEDNERRRKDRAEREREKEKEREREKRKERERQEEEERYRKSQSNGRHKVGEENNEADEDDDDYNYEEDFEDYEDDFEDDEDPEMKEEGEMEEVLRALDEENNRLASTSRRSNWSDSTELSDERFKDNHEDEPVSRAAPRAKTFINFISAKQRVMDNTVAGRVRKRFDDLSKLIELDVSAFDMFDLPPVKEYELYIRSFGRSDTQQAYVQTRDDDVERDVQTDEIEVLGKWTQHPPDDDTAVGGEGINVQALDQSSELVKKTDPVKVTQFLDRVGQWLFTVLEEESGDGDTEERRDRESRPTASFSENVSQLGRPNFLTGRQVLGLSFCGSDPNSLLSIHSSITDESEPKEDLSTIRASSPVAGEKIAQLSTFSLICVWNLSHAAYPQRICGSEMQITCGCFSPTKASLVFGGMHDGSVALWDLREPGSLHHSFDLDGLQHLVRFPTYNTAGVNECHQSPVVSIAAVYSTIVGSLKDEDITESSSGLSFQLASVDEKAIVNLWVVAEIAVPEIAGSMHDLGLSPGGKIKIMKSSNIVVNNPSKYLSFSPELKALDLQLNPGDLNHFYVGTDVGCVVHGVRFGSRVYPQSHSSLVDTPVPIRSIDFSPFGQPYFLAGCQDGTLHLFNTKMEYPVATWREFVSGESILSVRWSQSRPAVFFVLDNNSTVFTFDLVENGLTPIKMDRITKADAVSMEVGGDPNLLTPGVNRPAYMVIALDDGSTEVLSVSRVMREQQPLEEDFLATYVDRY